MAGNIILKRSSVAGKVPTLTDLHYGELALNIADRRLYMRDLTDNIVDLTESGDKYTQAEMDAKLALKLDKTANAVSATKLLNARSIILGGDVSGTGTYDGTANTSITVTVNNDSHAHTEATLPIGSTTAKGLLQLDSTVTSTSTALAATASSVKSAYDRGSLGISCGSKGIANAATAQAKADSAYNLAASKWTAVDASATVKGIVLLHDGIACNSITHAATANSAKTAYDRGTLGITCANTALANAATALSCAQTAQTTANGKWTYVVATTAVYGATKLYHGINSTDSTLAATAGSAKCAYDRGSLGITNAATAQARADSAYSLAGTACSRAVSAETNAKAYADQLMTDLMGGALPETLDTLVEITDHLTNDETGTAAIIAMITEHCANKSNPHAVTKAQVGLCAVNNWGASSAINSTSTATYSTAGAAKCAYDRGTLGITCANTAIANAASALSCAKSAHTAVAAKMTSFILEDADGTEVSIDNAKEVKFIGSNVSINWTDVSPGSDTDPFDLQFSVPDGSTSAKGVVQLTNGVTSTSTTTAATPASAKCAYDRGSLGITNAATAQAKADSAYSLAAGKWSCVAASTSVYGVTKLYHGVNSTSSGLAATAGSAKCAYDLAASKMTQATADGLYLGKSSNAVSASKWASARTISLTGDVSGSASIDGSANVSISVAVGHANHTHVIGNITDIATHTPEYATALSTTSINDLKTSAHAGFYYQDANANATTARGYPEAAAGSLLVQIGAGGVTQTYTIYNTGRVYTRAYYNTAWSGWRRSYDTVDKPSKADVGLCAVNNWGATTSVTSTSTTTYSTASAAKAAYDRGTLGITCANTAKSIACASCVIAQNALPLSGGTVTGKVTVTNSGSIAFLDPTSISWTAYTSVTDMNIKGAGGSEGFNIKDSEDKSILRVMVSDKCTFVCGELHATCNITSATNVGISSDRKLKDNLEVLTNPMAKIRGITGYTYDRIDLEDGVRHVGVIAQDVEAVQPELVIQGEDHKLVNYPAMTALLIEGMKEQDKCISDLNCKLDKVLALLSDKGIKVD